MFRDEGLEFRRVMFAGERVRVVTVGKQADFDVHTLFEQHINTTDRSFDTCGVPVIKHRHIVCEAVNHTDLSRGKRCSRRGHYILDAGLMHRDYVCVPFNQKATVLFYNRLFGKIDTV